MHGEREQDIGGWPGNMQEEADACPHSALAQASRQRNEVVIVDPDDVVWSQKGGDAIGEPFVDRLVADACVALVLGQVEAVVEQRPQRRIGIAFVIVGYLCGTEIDGGEGNAVLCGEGGLVRRRLCGFARPAKPQASAALQRAEKRTGQPTLRTSGAPRIRRGHPVGHNDETGHRKVSGI